MKKRITSLRKRLLLSLFFLLVIFVPVVTGKEIKVSAIQKVSLAGDDILQVEAQRAVALLSTGLKETLFISIKKDK